MVKNYIYVYISRYDMEDDLGEKTGLYIKGSFFSPIRFFLNITGWSFIVIVPFLYFCIYRFLTFRNKSINGKVFNCLYHILLFLEKLQSHETLPSGVSEAPDLF